MLKGGASIRHVQTMLGHRSISSTMVYTRLGFEDLKAALEELHPHGRLS
jgi:site-specific recombinase XerD